MDHQDHTPGRRSPSIISSQSSSSSMHNASSDDDEMGEDSSAAIVSLYHCWSGNGRKRRRSSGCSTLVSLPADSQTYLVIPGNDHEWGGNENHEDDNEIFFTLDHVTGHLSTSPTEPLSCEILEHKSTIEDDVIDCASSTRTVSTTGQLAQHQLGSEWLWDELCKRLPPTDWPPQPNLNQGRSPVSKYPRRQACPGQRRPLTCHFINYMGSRLPKTSHQPLKGSKKQDKSTAALNKDACTTAAHGAPSSVLDPSGWMDLGLEEQDSLFPLVLDTHHDDSDPS